MPMSATPLRTALLHFDAPRIDRWIGDADVVHGTNFVVPPTRAAAVVTIHDLPYLRYPEMCKRLVLQYPPHVGRALGTGAMVHTVSEFVPQEVIDHSRPPPEQVVAHHNGIPAPP